PRSMWITSRCVIARWGPPRSAARDACWLPPGSARPGCSTTSQLKSELPSVPTGEYLPARLNPSNHIGGIDVTNDAQVEDPPGHRHTGRPALRRLGDDRRRLDGRGRPTRGR